MLILSLVFIIFYGVFTLALLKAASDADDIMEDFKEEK